MSTNTNDMALCERLFNEYEPSLRNLCNYKLSSCPSEIDDVIADTYMALCDAINEGKEINNPKAWLYGTANNIIKIKYTEVKKLKKTRINIDSVEHELFYSIDLDEVNLNAETIDKLKDEILNELTGSERTLLILIYSKKLKFKEIAKILNISKDAVKQKHYRLKRKIMQLVKEKIKNFN